MAKSLLGVWLAIFIWICVEYYQLNRESYQFSLIAKAVQMKLLEESYLNPNPGRPLSLFLGYAGFGLMLLTNLYILRKRFGWWRKVGHTANWLRFHIFAGLLGPTFILFHCNFKVRGLVAISFWSMVVSVASGVVGRYFYLQIARAKVDYEEDAKKFWEKFKRVSKRANYEPTEQELELLRLKAIHYAGGTSKQHGLVVTFLNNMLADFSMLFSSMQAPAPVGFLGAQCLKFYGINYRKAQTVDVYHRLMGHWHTFHMPFAVFMYTAAIAHIVAALTFGV